MRPALVAVIALVAAVTAGGGGSHAHPSLHVAARGPLLAGQVLVVSTPGDGVRICGDQSSDLMFGPPGCAGGPQAVGLRTDMLPGRSSSPPERWGYLYLVGRYGSGRFSVTSQRLHGPPTPPAGTVTFAGPPCAAPRGGWLLQTPSQAQRSTIDHYSRLAHHHDLVDIAFYDHGSVLTVASSDPARTRAVLGPYWPHQLCVIRARYSRATLTGVGKRMVRLMTSRRSPSLGWISGAGGTCGSNSGQPKTCVEVLLETPQLRALVQKLPRGLVGVDAVLRPIGGSRASVSTGRNPAESVPCYDGHRRLVGPKVLRRFRAVTAVSCVDGTRTYPGRGQWSVRIRRVAVGSVAALQRYFEQPDRPRLPKGRGCLLVARFILVPTFVDGDGRWVVPRTPVNACGPAVGNRKAARRVRRRVVSVHKMRLMTSAAALAAHCSMSIKD